MAWQLALSLLALQGPVHVDPQGRFRIQVAEGFRLAPRFGDVDGQRFVLPAPPRRGGGPLYLEIRVAPPASCGTGEPIRLGGQDWREWVRETEMRFSHRAEERCLVVWVTGSKRALRRTEDRIHAMVASARLLGAPDAARASPSESSGPSARDAAAVLRDDERTRAGLASERAGGPDPWVGRWRAGDIELVLEADGGFGLGAWTGRWTRRGDVLRLERSPIERLDYVVRAGPDSLVLSGADLDVPVRFNRVGAPRRAR